MLQQIYNISNGVLEVNEDKTPVSNTSSDHDVHHKLEKPTALAKQY